MKILKTILLSFLIIAESQTVEIKAGYFFFTDSKMQKIYDKGGLDLQLSASYPLYCLDNCWTLNAYAAIEYFERSGRSLGDHQKTSVWAIPINFGLQPCYAITEDMQFYLTIGPRLFYLKQHNRSAYVYRHKSNNGVGLFANTGLNYYLNDCLRSISSENTPTPLSVSMAISQVSIPETPKSVASPSAPALATCFDGFSRRSGH